MSANATLNDSWMNIWPWTWKDICSLNEYISLNGYNFPEWICFPWTKIFPWMNIISLNEYNILEWTDKFLEMNIIPWTNIIASNDYICYLNGFISLTVNKYIISLKLNKYNSLKLHKYTVAGCKILPWVQLYILLSVNICISWILHHL